MEAASPRLSMSFPRHGQSIFPMWSAARARKHSLNVRQIHRKRRELTATAHVIGHSTESGCKAKVREQRSLHGLVTMPFPTVNQHRGWMTGLNRQSVSHPVSSLPKISGRRRPVVGVGLPSRQTPLTPYLCPPQDAPKFSSQCTR